MRSCSKCGQAKSLGDFSRYRDGRYRSYCKSCGTAATQDWYAKNAKLAQERNRARYAANREKIAAQRRQRYATDGEFRARRKKENKQWVLDNQERVAMTQRSWYEKNRARVIAKACAWYAANRKDKLSYATKYRTENPQKIEEYRKANAAELRSKHKAYCEARRKPCPCCGALTWMTSTVCQECYYAIERLSGKHVLRNDLHEPIAALATHPEIKEKCKWLKETWKRKRQASALLNQQTGRH